MQSRFTAHIEKHLLITSGEHLLLAVSGGIDSVVMTRLFAENEYQFTIAHCNFGLRGKDSKGDEDFVRKLAEELNVRFHVKCFETLDYASKNKLSIQMAARELRYAWFKELSEDNGFHKIATAHHATDNAETILINLLRGSGPEGLKGISPIMGNIIRPMLCFSKNEIESYATEMNFDFREDSSNLSEKYIRNKIRHRILPVMHEINPSFEKAMLHTSEIMVSNWNLIQEQILAYRNSCLIEKEKSIFYIDITRTENYPQGKFLLYYILNEVGVGRELFKEILESFHSESGKLFYTTTHSLLKDRDYIIVEQKQQAEDGFYFEIEEPGTHEFRNGTIKIEKLKRSEVRLGDTANIALLDIRNIGFPMVLRNWQEGDFFTPLGMAGSKLLSDFFIDLKIPLTRKSKIPILVCEGKIVWVVGYRISHSCKVDPKTEWVYRIKWVENN